MDEEKTLSDRMSGRLKHPEDAGGKRVLNTRFFRSSISRGCIKSIELPEQPQGVVSITNKNTAGKLKFGAVTMPVLSEKNILWKGEPILAAAGPDIDEVEDWISRIKIELLPTEETSESAVEEKIIEKGSVSEAFSRAFQVVEEKIEIPSSSASSEQQTVVCVKDGINFIIHAASSWPGTIRRNVAGVLKIDKKNIKIKNYPVSPESKRRIWCPAVNASRAALLSVKAKRSIRISSLPGESLAHGPGIPGADFHLRGAIDSEGRIIGMEIFFTIYAGAVFPLKEEFFDRVVLGLFSIYPCRNYIIHGTIRHKALPPSTFGTAAGFELGFLAGELFASRVAEHSLSTPGGWHRESFPVPGQAFGPGIILPKDFPMNDLLNKALSSSDFERKSASFEQTRLSRHSLTNIPDYYRGIGISCAWFGNGFLTSPKELGSATLTLTLDKKGELTIEIPSLNPGGTLEKAWA
ncbi:MAG: molybdopterin-dependent oxidoreductase, partial [Spirochaetaceae bacterium]|nr:molybdopterin-dependent oxidoreductase [Spirochaetaceae bacterium]